FGAILFLISFILALVLLLSGEVSIKQFFQVSSDLEVFGVYALMLVSLVAIVYSKSKSEDEYIDHIRLQSFFISIALHAAFFLIFSFTSLTIALITFPAIILMNSVLLAYLIIFSLQRRL